MIWSSWLNDVILKLFHSNTAAHKIIGNIGDNLNLSDFYYVIVRVCLSTGWVIDELSYFTVFVGKII